MAKNTFHKYIGYHGLEFVALPCVFKIKLHNPYIEIEISRLVPNLNLFIVSNYRLMSFRAMHSFVTVS